MVLQRNSKVNLWGEAVPNMKVTVIPSWNKKKYTTIADKDGMWKLQVETTVAGGPYCIEFSDGEKLNLQNILLGEVWICSGQSNMEMPVSGFYGQPCEGASNTILEAYQYSEIRLFTVERNSVSEPQKDCKGGEWLNSNPESVASFSAVGYYFGKWLNKMLGVPIGLITTNWGGSNIETWMTPESINAIDSINKVVAFSGENDNSKVAALYNGMVAPITNFTAKGFIWYQGESNLKNYYDYKKLQIAIVKLWREKWGNQLMPFYITQLAPYSYGGNNYRVLPLMIEAQYQAMKEISYCGIAATTDLGHSFCIHPPKKQEMGQRLAFLALNKDYGVKGLPADAPTYKSMEVINQRGILSFNNLSERNEGPNVPNSLCEFDLSQVVAMKGFEIAGDDKIFYPAKARLISWNKIEVYAEEVPLPVAVRYAFHNFEEVNVSTTYGQPLVPFRTDKWEISKDEIR